MKAVYEVYGLISVIAILFYFYIVLPAQLAFLFSNGSFIFLIPVVLLNTVIQFMNNTTDEEEES